MGNAAQTQGHLHLATVSPHQQSLHVFFPPLSHPHHRAATMEAPYNHLYAISIRRADHVRGTADQRGDRGGRRLPPHPVFTRSHPRGARSKPRIPRVDVALGAGARRAAAPRLSRRRRRVRACEAAATRRYRGGGAHTRGASMRGAARGAPDRGPLPHRLTGWPPHTRRCCHAGRGGGRRCGAGDHRGGRHRPPPRVHTRSVDGGHPLAGARTSGDGGQGPACPNPGRTPRR